MFPIPQQMQRIIAKEAEENKINAENFLENYLSVSFPEIVGLVQTRKATLSILESNKDFIDKTYKFGEIDVRS
jgi:hypothetical protein